MRIPCGRCGQLNELAGGAGLATQSIRCTGCGASYSLGRLARPSLAVAGAPTRTLRAPSAAGSLSGPRAGGGTAGWRKALITLMIVGAFGAVVHPGTFATFNAAVTNPATITTGTIVLSSSNPTAGTCLSVGAGTTINSTNSFTCGSGFLNITQSQLLPTAYTTTNLPMVGTKNIITLTNAGSLAANTVQLYAAAACAASAGAGTYKGANVGTSVGICNAVDLVIYEATDNTGNTMTTNGCLYGNTAGTGSTGPIAGCTFDKNTAAAPAAGVQPAYKFTPSDFGTCHLFTGSGACAGGGTNGPITIQNTTGTGNLVLTASPGNSAYIVVDIAFPDTGDQSVMGTVGSLNLTFQITE